MMSWFIDTLVWSGALIALVLVLRRPVARTFGAGMAYALWLLPLLRLVMPPLVLPAWLAPAVAPAPMTQAPPIEIDREDRAVRRRGRAPRRGSQSDAAGARRHREPRRSDRNGPGPSAATARRIDRGHGDGGEVATLPARHSPSVQR